MALTHFNKCVSCSIRPGDVIVHWHDPDPVNPRQFPLHVSIYVGAGEVTAGESPRLRIRGLPESRRNQDFLGDAFTGDKGAWFANMAGQRLDVDDVQLQEVVINSEAAQLELSQLDVPCEWNENMMLDPVRTIRGGIPLFLKGTCAHYVEWLYESVGLDLVNQQRVRDPDDPGRLYPAIQLHAFWCGKYPLNVPWDQRLRKYPDCLFGIPSVKT